MIWDALAWLILSLMARWSKSRDVVASIASGLWLYPQRTGHWVFMIYMNQCKDFHCKEDVYSAFVLVAICC
jgi:hypothetical protein